MTSRRGATQSAFIHDVGAAAGVDGNADRRSSARVNALHLRESGTTLT
jgi:hypothetical protein